VQFEASISAMTEVVEWFGGSELAPVELDALWQMAKANPGQPVFYPGDRLRHTVYKVAEGYLSKGRELGQGFWGKSCAASFYRERVDPFPNKRVLKFSSPSSVIGQFVSRVVKMHERMQEEARLLRAVYGIGEVVQVEQENFIVMPYLAEVTLDRFLKLSDLWRQIPLIKWISRCKKIAKKVQAVHETGYLHGDIKPQNIGLFLNSKEVNLLDFGSAHPQGTLALPGDKEYLAPEFPIPQYHTPKLDIYALGKTFLNVLQTIQGAYSSPQEMHTIKLCQDLALKMSSLQLNERPDLPEVRKLLKALQ
jgi:serine/threonine protein kinase